MNALEFLGAYAVFTTELDRLQIDTFDNDTFSQYQLEIRDSFLRAGFTYVNFVETLYFSGKFDNELGIRLRRILGAAGKRI